MLEAVFFDLDGTLVDTAPDFYVVLNQLLRDHGRPAVSYQAVRATATARRGRSRSSRRAGRARTIAVHEPRVGPSTPPASDGLVSREDTKVALVGKHALEVRSARWP